jgi:RNA polymerase sigma-70 factor (ECF subfamily)
MPHDHAFAHAAASRGLSTDQQMSDAALVGLIAQRDKHAMQVLFARYSVRIFRFLVRFVGSESLAEDLASETFIEVWRHAGQYEARSLVSTWLLAIARHKALSALRRPSTDELDDKAAESIEDHGDSPEAAMQKKERTTILRDCLKQLPPPHREVIDLVYYHERSIADVARIIGVPKNTAKTRMFYARRGIAKLMAAQGIERAWL